MASTKHATDTVDRHWRAYQRDRNDQEAKDAIIEANKGLILMVINRHFSVFKGRFLEEMIQEGRMGLLRALDKFDFSKGTQFSTYAHAWIKRNISRYLMEYGRTIPLPVYLHDVASRFKRVIGDFQALYVRIPKDDAELADFLGCDAELITYVRKTCFPKGVQSLDRPLSEDSTRTLGDIVASAEKPFEEVEAAQGGLVHILNGKSQDEPNQILLSHEGRTIVYSELSGALATLSEHELSFIALYAEGNTLEQVGEKSEVTRERARQVIIRGIRKLRAHLGIDQDLPINFPRHQAKPVIEHTEHRYTVQDFLKLFPKEENEMPEPEPKPKEVVISKAEHKLLSVIWPLLTSKEGTKLAGIMPEIEKIGINRAYASMLLVKLVSKGVVARPTIGHYAKGNVENLWYGRVDQPARLVKIDLVSSGQAETNRPGSTGQPAAPAPAPTSEPEPAINGQESDALSAIDKEVARLEAISSEVDRRLIILREARTLLIEPYQPPA